MRLTTAPPAPAMPPISSFARNAWTAKSPGTTRVRGIEASILHYDGAGRGMPGDLCGAIRFAGLGAEGAVGIAAAGHRNALAVLLPDLRAMAADLAAHYVTGSPVYGRPLPDLDTLLESRGLAGRYAGVIDTALEQAASEEQAALARVVAEDAKAASWMSAASFFNTIAHRTGLFQAAAHNIPAVSLPPPSLGQWTPAADAAVKGLTTALIQSRGYQPMLFSAAAGGAAALPAPGGGGGMASGLLGVYRSRQRDRRRQRQPDRRSRRPRPRPDERRARRHDGADGRRRRIGPARIRALCRQGARYVRIRLAGLRRPSFPPCSASC